MKHENSPKKIFCLCLQDISEGQCCGYSVRDFSRKCAYIPVIVFMCNDKKRLLTLQFVYTLYSLTFDCNTFLFPLIFNEFSATRALAFHTWDLDQNEHESWPLCTSARLTHAISALQAPSSIYRYSTLFLCIVGGVARSIIVLIKQL